jgi:predicted lactoylglutathione lyase/uncharacterized protein YndB with AHSA1/START domain
MAKQIFVNLPVKDLNKSIEFFIQLGFSFNPQFTNEEATCMILGENIFAMLLVEKRFRDFTKKEIADATKTTEVLIAIDAESKEKVIEMVEKAKAAGGTIYMDAADHGWMYQHSFADLDGHQWEIGFMDMSRLPADLHKEQTPKKISITIEAEIIAPIEKVWQYWTIPGHIVKWNNASDDWHTPSATNDLTVGGKFSSRMEAKDGSMGFDFEGTYTYIQPNQTIEYTIADGRNGKIDFIIINDHCKVIETFEAENTNPVELQQQGWQSILNNFKSYVESNL